MQVGIFRHDSNKSDNKTREFLYITIFYKLQIYPIWRKIKKIIKRYLCCDFCNIDDDMSRSDRDYSIVLFYTSEQETG